LQVTGKTRGASHISTQLIAHSGNHARIGEGKKEGNFNNTPDDHRNMPRQNRTKDHAAADEQCAPLITTSPDCNRGVHSKNKQQKKANLTKQTPWIRNADRHRDDIASPFKVADVCNPVEIDAYRETEIKN